MEEMINETQTNNKFLF